MYVTTEKRRRSEGKCGNCETYTGHVYYCDVHARKKSIYLERTKQRRIENKMCIRCGLPLSDYDIECGYVIHNRKDCKYTRSTTPGRNLK